MAKSLPALALALALAALLLATATGPAQAHKVIASVFASGTDIEGEIGFSNGDMAADTWVEVFDGQGTKLGQVKTDSDGFFVYTPTHKVNHVFRADLGAGHIATAVFDISEMSSTLTDNQAASGGDDVTSADMTNPGPETENVAITQQQEALIAAIVRDELRPLRREITAYKEKNDLQSILGGIGYIFGFFGIAYYIAARRLRAKDKQA